MNRPTVLHVIGSLETGGAEMRLLEDARVLAERGVTVSVVTTSGRRGRHAHKIEAMGGSVTPMALSPSFPLRFIAELWSVRPQAVHSHVGTASSLILTLARVARVRYRVAHGRSGGDGRTPTRTRRVNLALRRTLIRLNATTVWGVSPDALAFIGGRAEASKNTQGVLPNAFDLSRLPPQTERPHRDHGLMVHVGRSNPAKNRMKLIEILSALVSDGHDWRLTLVGQCDDAEHQVLIQAAELAGVADRLDFVGEVEQVLECIQGADVFVLPSLREGLPGVVVEARAVGLPVVATDLPGVRLVADELGRVTVLPVDAAANDWARAVLEARSEASVTSVEDQDWVRRRLHEGQFSQQKHVEALLSAYGLAAATVRTGGPGADPMGNSVPRQPHQGPRK